MGPSAARTFLFTAALLLGGGPAPGWLLSRSGVGVAEVVVLLGVLVIAVVVAVVIVVVIWRAIRRD